MFRAIQRRSLAAIPRYDPITPELGNIPMIAEAGSLTAFLDNSMQHFNSDIF